MVRRIKAEALVLSRKDTGEADRLVTLFTKRYGLLRVLAKGVRKIPSRRGGHLEPYSRILVMFAGSGGRYFLTTSEVVDYFEHLRSDGEILAHAQVLNLLLTGLFEEEDAQPKLFRALFHTWRLLPGLLPVQRAVLEVAVSLLFLRHAGVLPALTACCHCGQASAEQGVVLDPREGGWYCLLCSVALPRASTTIPSSLLGVLRFLSMAPERALRVRVQEHEAWQLVYAMRSYVAEAVGGSLRRYLSEMQMVGAYQKESVAV